MQTCPVCGLTATFDGVTVVCSAKCGSYSVSSMMMAELDQARAGVGQLAGLLESLSDALSARAITELQHVDQVVSELDEFVDSEDDSHDAE